MTAPPFPAAAIDAVRAATAAHLRIAGPAEDATLATMAASALALAEAFTGQALIAREWVTSIATGTAWQPLPASPVHAIVSVEGRGIGGEAIPLAPGAHAIDIDGDATGWVRVPQPGVPPRATVRYRAGLAETWSALPPPIAQGVVMLAAHLFAARDDDRVPPAAVAALWRPYRRMRLTGAVR